MQVFQRNVQIVGEFSVESKKLDNQYKEANGGDDDVKVFVSWAKTF